MLPYNFKNLLALLITTSIIFYLIIAGINLSLRLTSTRQPECTPVFCKALVDEASYCLISTPGADSCLKVAGKFFIPSTILAYLLLFTSFGAALYIYKKFYLSRWLICLSLLAFGIFSVRVFLGAASFSIYGVVYEFQKLGLY